MKPRQTKMRSDSVEIHIEQGPVLEAERLSVAAVTGIVGQTRLSLEFTGQANHAGTTPMHLAPRCAGRGGRVDHGRGIAGAATEGLVATVGKIVAMPNAGNVIAGTARSDASTCAIRTMRCASPRWKSCVETADAIADRRGLALQCNRQMDQPAVPMDERLTALLGRCD